MKKLLLTLILLSPSLAQASQCFITSPNVWRPWVNCVDAEVRTDGLGFDLVNNCPFGVEVVGCIKDYPGASSLPDLSLWNIGQAWSAHAWRCRESADIWGHVIDGGLLSGEVMTITNRLDLVGQSRGYNVRYYVTQDTLPGTEFDWRKERGGVRIRWTFERPEIHQVDRTLWYYEQVDEFLNRVERAKADIEKMQQRRESQVNGQANRVAQLEAQAAESGSARDRANWKKENLVLQELLQRLPSPEQEEAEKTAASGEQLAVYLEELASLSEQHMDLTPYRISLEEEKVLGFTDKYREPDEFYHQWPETLQLVYGACAFVTNSGRYKQAVKPVEIKRYAPIGEITLN